MAQTLLQRYIETILKEYKAQYKNGIYGLTQKEFGYNSNKIEGSSLTIKQTASIFETGTLDPGGIYRAKDIEEITGHFTMFNYMLETYDKPLTEELVKEYHAKLKAGVFEDILNGYPIGDYKNRANMVSDIITSLPREVPNDMKKLLDDYCSIAYPDLKDLAEFHIRFETIHPFQDGNGRVGRMILFKECLKHQIIPFIIEDTNRITYYNALSAVDKLEELFKQEQKIYTDELIPYIMDTK